jgi:hypothetical protein
MKYENHIKDLPWAYSAAVAPAGGKSRTFAVARSERLRSLLYAPHRLELPESFRVCDDHLRMEYQIVSDIVAGRCVGRTQQC